MTEPLSTSTDPLKASTDYAKAIGVGVATAVVLSLIMVPLVLTGVSPFPKPLVLVSFFPIAGWGFAGLAEGPSLIIAPLIPHILFAVVL